MNYDGISTFLLDNEPEVTEEVVAYYRKHPEELAQLTNKEVFHLKFLSLFFGIGFTLTIGSRVMQFIFEDFGGAFFNDVILDVLSELGIAIFGGAVTAYLLEFLQKKQFEQNIQFREKVKAKLRES